MKHHILMFVKIHNTIIKMAGLDTTAVTP